MHSFRQSGDSGVLVRFWSLDHHRAEPILWAASDWAKLVFAVEGVLHVDADGVRFVLPANRALFIPAGRAHPAKTCGPARVRSLYFSPGLAGAGPPRVLRVRPLFRELIAEACRIGPLRAREPRESAAAVLLMHEIETADEAGGSIPMPEAQALRDWAEAFLLRPNESLPAIGSRRTIERRFRAETGMPLGRWQRQARALAGLQALAAGASVQEAACEAGYQSSSGFIQAFRRQFGSTPGRAGAESASG